ncbi:STE/STE11 protein kinase [Coprinopsis cinerea AmutBmut pab1-1]|nr:STE/STE11 protein kinase [Coprinopsis cinerea AmutBmut pab1-1]
MHSGRIQPQAWSTFANFFPHGDAPHLATSPLPVNESHGHFPSPQKVGDEDVLGDSELDKEQRVSAAFIDADTIIEDHSPSISPVRPSVSQPTTLASSPAALFLSAFMGSKPEPEPLEDDEGQKVGSYTLGKVVGFGAFSTIRTGVSESGSTVAVKIVRRADLVRTGHAPEERKRLQHEASIWSSLSHEHILPLFSALHTSYADYFVTIYCPAGSLYDILKRDGRPALPQDDAGMMFRQVVRGLRYLHEVAGLVHRDIKLENVLVDESGVCRIGDFGLSVRIGDVDDEDGMDHHHHEHHPIDGACTGNIHRAVSLSFPSKRHRAATTLGAAIARHNSTRNRHAGQSSHVYQPGSLPYAAPELLLPNTADMAPAHPGQDIWALGVMLYALLTGHLPFNDSFEPRLQMKILNGTFEIPADIGRGAERILQGCMERIITKRWTIAMVDEVSWGVGWGSAGDNATPDESQEDLLAFHAITSPLSAKSCSESRLDRLTIPESDEDDWQHEEHHFTRSAIEAGSRRSSSRAKRSQSRAPMSARSHSRQCSPHRSARSSSRMYSGFSSAAVSRSHSPATSPLFENPPSRSRSQSRHRGRQPNKRCYFASRSPSPSWVPSTPSDISHISRLSLREPSEDLHLDSPPRGRTRFSLHHETFDEGDEATEGVEGGGALKLTHAADGTGQCSATDWTSRITAEAEDHVSPERASSRPNIRSSWTEIPFRNSRPGSTPPASSKTWELFRNKASHGLLSRNPSQDMCLGFPSPGLGTPGIISRSRSIDQYHDPTRTAKVEIPPASSCA